MRVKMRNNEINLRNKWNTKSFDFPLSMTTS
jgi:hypothetical protein